MTREHIEFVLSEYSTDALAGKLLELFDEEATSYQYTINKLNKTLSENKGEWISHYDEDTKEGWYECSCCHSERAFNTNYCPDCGADMREPKEEKSENV